MADSPFSEPGVQFAWDSTSLGLFKECPRKYYYTMIEGWRKPGGNVHLEFGGLFHKALEMYDHMKVQGAAHPDALRHVVRYLLTETFVDGKPVDWGHNLKTRHTLIRSVIWYLDHYEHDRAETVILDNGKPAVELSFRFDAGNSRLLCGHLDRVVEFQDSRFVMDRKTSSSTISSYYFDQYAPDNQMSLYTMAGQIILQSPVRGVIIDAVQIAVGFSRFERGFTYRTEAQVEEWLHDFHHWADLANDYGTRSNKPDVRDFPMNDKSCHDYGGCPFRSICSSDPRVRQTFLESNFIKQQWNPLEIR